MDLSFGQVLALCVTAIFIGMVASFFIGLIKLFFVFRTKIVLEKVADSLVMLSIEAVKHRGQEMFLVYEVEKNKFVTQGTSAKEIQEALLERFRGKHVYVKIGEDQYEPILAFMEKI